MTRRCMVTGKGALVGHKVSHANNKTKRRFLPSVKTTRIYSEALGRSVPVKLSTHGLRSVEHKGGLDAWLVGTAPSKLDASLRPLKAQIEKKMEGKDKPAPKAKKAPAKKAVRPKKEAAPKKETAAKKAPAKKAAAKKPKA